MTECAEYPIGMPQVQKARDASDGEGHERGDSSGEPDCLSLAPPLGRDDGAEQANAEAGEQGEEHESPLHIHGQLSFHVAVVLCMM